MQNLSCENEFYLHDNKKSFSQERFCTWPRFKTEACGISEMAYSITRQSVISQLERVKGRDTRDVFRGNLKRGLGFQDAFLPFVYISILR